MSLCHGDHGLFIRLGFAIDPADKVLHVLPFRLGLARFVAVEQPGLVVDGREQVVHHFVTGFFLGASLHAVDEVAEGEQVFVLARLQLMHHRAVKCRLEQADVARSRHA